MGKRININEDWRFSKDCDHLPTAWQPDWELVDLPHCWNRFDGQDGGADYFRGKCWYLKELKLPERAPESKVFLEIPAASGACVVYLNGRQIASHEGGYSIFRTELTPYADEDGRNLLAISVDNGASDFFYPQTADFTFYGGLYRGVEVIITNQLHFDLSCHGGAGIAFSSEMEGEAGVISLRAFVKGEKPGDFVEFTIFDQDGQEKGGAVCAATKETKTRIRLEQAHLWQGVEDPYLYTITAQLIRHNEVQDEAEARLGIRSFYADPQKGFFLNDKLTPLRGVSRHQDRLDQGYALSYEDHLEDALIIKELGANTIRLAHYQHSQEFYDLCDEMGFVVWAEIPFISNMLENPKAHENCISQLKELIYQNYNHPCILFWGISNEITIGGIKPGLQENLQELNDLAHSLDPTRLTTIAQMTTLPMEHEQNLITDVVAYNHYFGWYKGTFDDNEVWLDQFHAMHRGRALGISEYGCEGIVSYHSDEPKAGDYSEEYQSLYHEHMASVIAERPWLWATYVWNMFDFGCDARDEGGVKGRNNKGLVSMDRRIYKDSFYLYQSYWSREPVVHICSKRYGKRHEAQITVKVYTNCQEISLLVDGKLFATKGKNQVLEFPLVPLKNQFTMIEAVGENHVSDSVTFEKVEAVYEPYHFEDKENPAGVLNWFDEVDFTNIKPPTYEEGYFSVKDRIKEILDNEEASKIAIDALSSILKMPLKKSMAGVLGDRTIEEMAGMAAGQDISKQLNYLNERLQGIRK